MTSSQPSLFDKLPQDAVNHIYGYVLAMILNKPSRDKHALKMLLDSQFCIIMPCELFQAIQLLAAHLGVPYERMTNSRKDVLHVGSATTAALFARKNKPSAGASVVITTRHFTKGEQEAMRNESSLWPMSRCLEWATATEPEPTN